MSSAWEFVKKHRNKLIFGGILAGGAYVAHRAIQTNRQFMQQQHPAASVPISDELRAQARRHYIFDSNHRTCDTNILELIPTLRGKIQLRFDVEALTERLRIESTTFADKIQLWEQIKVLSFSRVIAVAYTYTLLTVTLKCQISMLAAQMTTTTTATSRPTENSWWWNDTIAKVLGYQSTTPNNCIVPSIAASTQQLFLQCIQYFTTHGVDQLLDRIESAVRVTVANVDLKAPANLADLFNAIRLRIEGADARNFSYLIVALGAAQDAHSVSAHRSRLESLLRRLVELIESAECKQLTADLVSSYITGCIRFCTRTTSEDAPQQMAFAKLLPIIADSFQFVASDEFDSPMQDSLSSNELHRFAMNVFNMAPIQVVPSVSID